MKVDNKSKTKRLQSGAIENQAGRMFNGKTAELIYRINRYTRYDNWCMVVKCKTDNRYSIDRACSHDGASVKATGAISLQDVYDKIVQNDLIGEYSGWGRFIRRL